MAFDSRLIQQTYQAQQAAVAKRQAEAAQRAQLANRINDQYNRANSRPTPQAGRTQLGPTSMVDTTRADQFREREIALANQLAGVASGTQKGAGELAVGRQVGQALGQAYGAATMARGVGAAGGARAAARAAGSIGVGGAGMAQEAALNDQTAARQQLAAVLGQGRSADLSTAAANAGALNAATSQQGSMDQQLAIANMEAQLRAQGMNDQQIMQILGLMEGRRQYDQSRYDARNPSFGQILGGVAGQAGQVIGALA